MRNVTSEAVGEGSCRATGSGAGALFAQQSVEAGSIFRTAVEFVVELGDMAKGQGASYRAANKAISTAKSANRFGRSRLPFKVRKEDLAAAQIATHFHGCKRDAAQPGIFQVAQQHLR